MEKTIVDILDEIQGEYYMVEMFGLTRESIIGLCAIQDRLGLSQDECINLIINNFVKDYDIDIDEELYSFFKEEKKDG